MGSRAFTVSERALMVVVLLGGVAVLVLWWHDTTMASGFGEWLTEAGRMTGLLGGYSIAIALLLMSRAPWIDHGIGTDRLARWHAITGRYAFGLLSAHAVLITWGYASAVQSGVLAEARLLLTAVPDVLLATIGFALLVVVGVISARQVRQRVTYETWYLLHLLTYLAVGLSFLHVIKAGADFQTGWAKVAWILLYAAITALLLWYRWLTPLIDAYRHRLRIESVVPEAPGVVSITFTGRDLDRLGVRPGQFFRWRFLTRRDWWQSHPYSLSAMPTSTRLRISVKALGDHSGELGNLQPGTRVIAEGPYGALTPAHRRGHGVLLLAGGIGITPLRTMLEHLGPDVGPVTLIYRARTSHDLLFQDELDELARADHIEVIYTVGAAGGAEDVLVEDRLVQVVSGIAARDAFVCGPPGFMDSATEALVRAGVHSQHIHIEQFEF
jgi:predicted ferric reductase